MLGQRPLFDPLAEGGRERALSSLHAIGQLLAQCPVILAAADIAATDTAGAGGNRGNGEAFEDAFAAQIATPAAQAGISYWLTQMIALEDAAPAFDTISSVTLLPGGGGGRGAADLVLTLTTVTGATLRVAVNVKRNDDTRAAGVYDACALRTAIRTARGEEPGSTTPVNVPRTALRWLARKETIQPGEYLLLVVRGDRAAGTVTDIHCQGLLGGVLENGELAMRRHPNREVALYRPAAGVVADDVPGTAVNDAFARALCPAPDGDDVRLAMVTWLAARRGLDADATAALAARVDAMDDDELADALATVAA